MHHSGWRLRRLHVGLLGFSVLHVAGCNKSAAHLGLAPGTTSTVGVVTASGTSVAGANTPSAPSEPAQPSPLAIPQAFKAPFEVAGFRAGYLANGGFAYCHSGATGDPNITVAAPGCMLQNDLRAEPVFAATAQFAAGTALLPEDTLLAFAQELEPDFKALPPVVTPLIRIGAKVGAAEPIFIHTLRLEPVQAAGEGVAMQAQGGGVVYAAVAPDKSSLDIVFAKFTRVGSAPAPGTANTSQQATLRMARFPYARFVARAANELGLRSHRNADYAPALKLFEDARALDASWELPHYNCACAHVRLGNAQAAQAALGKAIEISGDVVRVRARADVDFANVRRAKWFRRLTAPVN